VGLHSCPLPVNRGRIVTPFLSAGPNHLSFAGRVQGKPRLAPGKYTVSISATSAGGQRSKALTLSFTIAP
jgi:hypothetical protein